MRTRWTREPVEDRVKLRDRGITADWEVFWKTPWNDALNVNASSLLKSMTATMTTVGECPFTTSNALVRLKLFGLATVKISAKHHISQY
jgi:hypothetical protein